MKPVVPIVFVRRKNLRLPEASHRAFTILETLVSFAVLAILLVILTTMISRTSSVWNYTRGQAEQFREARDAFDALTRRLGEATLGTYLDYEDKDGLTRTAATATSFVPKTYGRQSELRFLSGPGIHGESHAVFFQTPLGKGATGPIAGNAQALNTLGYFLKYDTDAAFLPGFLKPRIRFRLMEFCEPSESLSVYQFTSGSATAADRISRDWFTTPLGKTGAPVSIVAENIIALVLLPTLPATDQQAGGYTASSLAPDYTYDSTARVADPRLNSRHQLPPVIQVTMIAMDERSAARLTDSEAATLQSEVATRFLKSADYQKDLDSLRARLTEMGISFRVFSTNLILKNAKWSREQKG